MNRTGLLAALAVAAVVGLVFAILPALDLKISALFLYGTPGEFKIGHDERMLRLRDISMWIAAALAPARLRPFAYAAAIAYGLAVGGLRITFGGHFFTDVIFSGVFTFLIIWTVHGLIYRWPATRLTDQGIERLVERIAMPIYA